MLTVVNQKRNSEYYISNFRIQINEDLTFSIIGFDTLSKQEVELAIYYDYLFASKVFAEMCNRRVTQYKGGSRYNIYEMPYQYDY